MNLSLGESILVLVIYVLAVMRVTRLLNYDTVLDGPRVALMKIFGRDSAVVYFFGCPWCVGFWVALATAIVPVLIIGWPWWALIALALATSHLVGLFAGLSADEDMEVEEIEVED
ncbi:membrane protein [Gordonia phage Evaa]|nr:membrane protein [Gordonia phage Evaa]